MSSLLLVVVVGSPGCPGSKTAEMSSALFIMFNFAGFDLHFCILDFWERWGWMATGDGAVGLVVEGGPSAAGRWFSVPWWLVIDMWVWNSFLACEFDESRRIF